MLLELPVNQDTTGIYQKTHGTHDLCYTKLVQINAPAVHSEIVHALPVHIIYLVYIGYVIWKTSTALCALDAA